jgi:hypothetical protein
LQKGKNRFLFLCPYTTKKKKLLTGLDVLALVVAEVVVVAAADRPALLEELVSCLLWVDAKLCWLLTAAAAEDAASDDVDEVAEEVPPDESEHADAAPLLCVV